MKVIIVQQKMVSSVKSSVILDSDALLMSKQSSDAYQELTKIYQVKNHAKYVQLGIIAMKIMVCQYQLHKNAPKGTTVRIFPVNLLRTPILLQFMHLFHVQLELTVMSQNLQVSLNVSLALQDIDVIEGVKRHMTMDY